MIHRSYYRNMRFRFGRAFGEEFLACFEDPHTLAFEAFSDTGNKSREVHRLRRAQTGLHHLDLIKEFIKRPPVWVECELGTTHCLQPFVDVLPTNTKLQPGSIPSALAGFRNASLPHGRSKKWLHPRGLLLPVGGVGGALIVASSSVHGRKRADTRSEGDLVVRIRFLYTPLMFHIF